jgi:hypothetical protein
LMNNSFEAIEVVLPQTGLRWSWNHPQRKDHAARFD